MGGTKTELFGKVGIDLKKYLMDSETPSAPFDLVSKIEKNNVISNYNQSFKNLYKLQNPVFVDKDLESEMPNGHIKGKINFKKSSTEEFFVTFNLFIYYPSEESKIYTDKI